MTREGERELVKVEHVNGGDGYIVREAMVTSCLLYTSRCV